MLFDSPPLILGEVFLLFVCLLVRCLARFTSEKPLASFFVSLFQAFPTPQYFAETLHPRMSIDHYVFDAVLNPDLSLSLVEINTPPPVAGALVFVVLPPTPAATQLFLYSLQV